MTGVTTILGVIGKPLTWWAAGKALETLGWTNPKFVKREEGIKSQGKLAKTSSSPTNSTTTGSKSATGRTTRPKKRQERMEPTYTLS